VKAGFIAENGRTQEFPEVSWAIDGNRALVSDKAPEFALPGSELAWNCFWDRPRLVKITRSSAEPFFRR
jgi:hypothetical protein